MMMFISVFLMKLADCALSTMKTVFLCKNRFFISSVLNSVAAVLFILVADSMAVAPEDKKVYIAIAIFLANFLGSYFPPKLMERFEADKLFIYVITAKSLEKGKEFSDKLRELNIPISTTVVYNQETENSLSCNAYCNTRKESKIVDMIVNLPHLLTLKWGLLALKIKHRTKPPKRAGKGGWHLSFEVL